MVVALAALAGFAAVGIFDLSADIFGLSVAPHGVTHALLLLVWAVVVLAGGTRVRAYVRDLRKAVAVYKEQLEGLEATSSAWLWEASVGPYGEPELTFTSCSPGVAAFLGWSAEEVVGRPLLDFICPEHIKDVRDRVASAVDNGHGWHDVEVCWRHADGRDVWMVGNAVPVFDQTGKVVAFRGTRRLAPPDTDARHRIVQIRARVESLIAGEALTIALQPIVSLETNRWVGVEALARFPDGRPPDVWFAEAHEAGLGIDLELAAVRLALRQLDDLPGDVSLAVNASPQLILDGRLAETLTAPGMPAARVTVEMTEHAPVAVYDDIRRALAPLRALGVRLAVDDTGAGYSSFTHVLALRPDSIKLDRSLVAGIDADPARRAFVTAIVLLALELRADVTGEGVETAAEHIALATLGVDHAQGYHLARPTTDPGEWHAWAEQAWPPAAVALRPLHAG